MPTASVLAALQSVGVTFSRTVTVELRSGERVHAVSGPHTLGLTRTLVSSDGRTAGRIVITLLAGMPASHFAMVFAHELGHAVMYDGDITGLPPRFSEGMAEFFAFTYLTRPDAAASDQRLAESIATNPDRCTATVSARSGVPSTRTASGKCLLSSTVTVTTDSDSPPLQPARDRRFNDGIAAEAF